MYQSYISVSRQQEAKGVASVSGTVSDDKQNELRYIISCPFLFLLLDLSFCVHTISVETLANE